MLIDEYRKWTRKTAIYPKENALEYVCLGLAGEVGEVCNKIKKVIRDDNKVLTDKRREDIIDEFGDVMYYTARLADELNIDFMSIIDKNMSKLEDRLVRGVLKGSGDKR